MNGKGLDLAVIVPTYEEAGNVGPLLSQIADSLPGGTRTCVLFVDDSPTRQTVEAVISARPTTPTLTIEIIHRSPEQRAGGLASAVKLGIEAVPPGTKIVVMDADLQHPPATIPDLLAMAQQTGADLVMASRYRPGGRADGLGKSQLTRSGLKERLRELIHRFVRHVVSRLSTLIALVLFPRALHGVTDPMTGFFLVQREAIDTGLLDASGFKILLELLVTHPQLRRAEVPLQFGARIEGESKGTAAQGLHYLRQVRRLRLSARHERVRKMLQMFRKLTLFGLVGLSVFGVINVGLLYVLVQRAYWDSSIAEAFVLVLSVIANYWLNRRLTWKVQANPRQAFRFMASRVATLLLSFAIFSLLVRIHVHYQLANVISVVAGMAINFVAADKWVFTLGGQHNKLKRPDEFALGWRAATAMLAGLTAFTVGLRFSTHGLFVSVGLALLAAAALAWAAQFLVSTVYPHRNEDAINGLRIRAPKDPPTERIAALIPARHEELVLGHTLLNAAFTQTDHPVHQFAVITCDDDPATTRTALVAARIVNSWCRAKGRSLESLLSLLEHPSERQWYADTPLSTRELAEIDATQHNSSSLMQVIVYPLKGQRPSKAKQLNYAFHRLGEAYSVYTIIDAESTVQTGLFAHIDQAFQDFPDTDTIQGPVQLMDPTLRGAKARRALQVCRRWYAWINLLEYFRWFSGQMAFQAANQFVPWGGNTVFVRTALLLKTGGWVDSLTEDCSTGVLGSAIYNAKTITFYNPALATREETPPTASELGAQRTRWTQGFFQTLIAGQWKAMPTIRQRFFALWILANPFFQAVSAALLPVTLTTMVLVKSPPILVLLMCLPLGAMVVATILQLVQLHEYGKAYDRHVPWYAYVLVIVMQAPYQWLLSYAAFRAAWKHFTGQTDWHKTDRAGDLIPEMSVLT